MFVLIPLGTILLLWLMLMFIYWERSWGIDPFTHAWQETLHWFNDQYPYSLLALASLVPLVWILDTFRWRLLKVLVPLSALVFSGYGLERYWLNQRAWTGIVDGRWRVIARGWPIVWHSWPLVLTGVLLGGGLVYTLLALRPPQQGLARWRRRLPDHSQAPTPPPANIDADTLHRACQRAYQQGLETGRRQADIHGSERQAPRSAFRGLERMPFSPGTLDVLALCLLKRSANHIW